MLKIGHEIVRPGKSLNDPEVTIGIPEELETTPGVPMNQREVDWYAREYPLETQNITERASREWANTLRDQHAEMREIRKEHDRLNKPLIMAARLTGDQEPTAEPTGEDVSQLIKNKAREVGFQEVGITAFDLHYTYQSKKDWVKFPHVICLGYEQDFEPTQTIPSVDAEIVHSSTYRTEGARFAGARKLHPLPWLSGAGAQPQRQHRPLYSVVRGGRSGPIGRLWLSVDPSRGQPPAHYAYNHRRQRVLRPAGGLWYPRLLPGLPGLRQPLPRPGPHAGQDLVEGCEKNKLYFKRCRPVMARYLGCGICMKVCPVQKYGLKNVMEHYAATGQVMGKGTHDLEGYTLEGKGYFGPGELPVFESNFFSSMPHGDMGEHTFEQFKAKAAEAGGEITDELLADFKRQIGDAIAMDAGSADMMQMPDYI